MTRVCISSINDPQEKIIAAMFNISEPARISDIARETKQKTQMVGYHIKELIKIGIVKSDNEIEGCKYYKLQPLFYDESLFEGLSRALLPVADSSSEGIDVSEECEIDNPNIHIIRAAINLFLNHISADIDVKNLTQ